MILSHTNAIEKVLIAQSQAAQHAGHPNLRGGPREWFIHDFLEDHLPSRLEIGQGEIIDEDSRPDPPRSKYRPQVDIVIYRNDLPRISYSPQNTAYLAEGVIATIESKSTLAKDDLEQACRASLTHKSLKRSPPQHSFGQGPPKIQSYVLAYDGPQNMSTVANWLPDISHKLSVPPEELVDLVVVLGKGVIWHSSAFKEVDPLVPPENATWAYFEQEDRNLFMLFMHMLTWVSYLSVPPSALGYVSRVFFEPYQTI